MEYLLHAVAQITHLLCPVQTGIKVTTAIKITMVINNGHYNGKILLKLI
jgi:hypothetical protein